MIKYILRSIIISFCLGSNIAWAKVARIRIDDALDVGVKVIICQNTLKPNAELTKINEIITNDLTYSGEFKVGLYDHHYSKDLQDNLPRNNLADFDFKFWRDLGGEFLIVTKMYPVEGARKLVIGIELFDLYKPLNPVVAITEILKNPNDNLRYISHQISDFIFEKLIGMRGFFRTKIAYVRVVKIANNFEYSLNIADFDGFNEHKLLVTNYPIMSPKWSPDRTKLAFVSFKGNRSSINIIDLKRERSTVITKYPGINGAPAWSPKGDQLALVLSKDGNPSIYVLNLMHNELYRLTQGIGIDTEPCWKDQDEIYFTSNRGGKPQIYKVNLHSKKISRVSFNGEYNATPGLTPDNRYLVMLHCTENCSTTKLGFKIAIQSLETGKVKLLTNNGMEDTPTLSPNGLMAMYSTRLNENADLSLAAVSLESGLVKYLPIEGKGSLKSPTWSANPE